MVITVHSAAWYQICIGPARIRPGTNVGPFYPDRRQTMQNDSSDPEKSFDGLPRAALTRRGFIQTAVATIGGLAAPVGGAEAAAPARPDSTTPAATVPVLLRINGREHRLNLEPRVTLLDALREVVGLTGAKKGCDRGQCGACTVLVEGRRINACLTLAIMHEGQEVTTIEGLGQEGALHPLQAAFIERDAFQCGYCTPGQICSAAGLLNEAAANAASAVTRDVRQIPVALDQQEIRERMSGNLCRCGAYPNIVAAVQDVAGAKA